MPLSHMAPLIAFAIATYSTLVVEKSIVSCKVAFQLIAQPPIVKMYQVKDLLSESTYPIGVIIFSKL